jgi:type II secretory pathway component PulF
VPSLPTRLAGMPTSASDSSPVATLSPPIQSPVRRLGDSPRPLLGAVPIKKGVFKAAELRDPAQLAKRLGSASLKTWSDKKKVPIEIITVFTTEFAIMVRTSLPIVGSLESLKKQQAHPKFKAVIGEICRLVTQGNPLSQGFAQFPTVFDPIYVSLVAAGEASGTLPLMLERLAAYLNFQRELKEKIRMALLYPAIVVLTCTAVVSFLVFFILPTFSTIFTEMNIELPLPTRMMLFMSHHLRSWWWIYGLIVGAAWGYAMRWSSDPVHAMRLDTFQLKLPVIGRLIRNVVMTRILRTLSSLVDSGVPILMSLDLARAAANNAVFRAIVDRIHASAREGKGLATPLYGDPYFPEPVMNMIANAEKMGALPEVLSKAADYYEHETDISIKKSFAILEPVFVVFLGLMVASIAVAVLLPIFQMSAGVQ